MILDPRAELAGTSSAIFLEKSAFLPYLSSRFREVESDPATGFFVGRGFDGPGIGFLHAAFSPQTALKLEQAHRHYGVERIVRIGTCGALRADIPVGTILIHSGAVRDEGTSHCYVPSRFPAVADEELMARFMSRLSGRAGITWTTDGRYAESNAKLKRYRELNVLSVEMETAALYVTGRLRGVKTLSLSVVSDRPICDLDKDHKGAIDPDEYERVVVPQVQKCIDATCEILSKP